MIHAKEPADQYDGHRPQPAANPDRSTHPPPATKAAGAALRPAILDIAALAPAPPLHRKAWGQAPHHTPGADKAYDASPFIGALRARGVTPQIAVNGTVPRLGRVRKTAIDEQVVCPPAMPSTCAAAIASNCVERSSEPMAFMPSIGWLKAEVRCASGKPRVNATFTLAVAAC